MGVEAIAHYVLPDSAYLMWVRDELVDYLHLPKDGTRVEIIGGEIVVSPGPTVGHNGIVRDVERGVFAAELADPAFIWRSVQTTDLNMFDIGDGYIPDLILLEEPILREARASEAKHLLPHQVDLVVEVTSISTAVNDREPKAGRRPAGTKWSGYAHSGIPYYLLIDRDPRAAKATLYGMPERRSGMYKEIRSWDFGETIRIGAPFGFDISTEQWTPWDD